jgi:hypothetical protein
VVLMLTAPVLPGRAEAWRRMCQELLGSRAERFAASACRLGVRSQQIWLVPIARGELALIWLDVANPELALNDLAASEAPFDRWLRRQLQHLIGIDLAALAEAPGELVLEWTRRHDEHGNSPSGGGDESDDRG